MFAHLDGLKMYYEKTGVGEPVILIHGNSETHDIFDVVMKDLSETHTVYAPDSRCHGQSSTTEEISYSLMADDIIAFIRTLDIERPVLYGFSDGGIIGLMVAMKAPSILKSLIISGANLNPKGLKLSSRIGMWPRSLMGDRLYRMMLREPDMRPEDLGRITIPVHILAGEKDCIRKEHTELIASSIPDSTLKILAGEDHSSYIVHSEKLFPIISEYID